MLFRSNDTATTEIYTRPNTLSLHDALPISDGARYLFRVTAIGYGVREETQVVLQTTLFKPAASPGCPS